MPVDENALAVLLLTLSLGGADREGPRPLTGPEWHRLGAALRDRGLGPASLLRGDASDLLSGWGDATVGMPRLRRLLDRGPALGVALGRWERAGLWVVVTSDHDYPARLRERLGGRHPPALFGCGPRSALGNGGVAVVGSRDAGPDGLGFARRMGAGAAADGCAVVSGGARGVDRGAIFGALERGGSALGVLGNGLLDAAGSARYREYLLSANLTLVSPFDPESGFHFGRAMERNRYIYCLADSAVVVSSALGRGGTWWGATECLRAGWVPVWARDLGGMCPGNAELLRRGARGLAEPPASVARLAETGPVRQPGLPGIA